MCLTTRLHFSRFMVSSHPGGRPRGGREVPGGGKGGDGEGRTDARGSTRRAEAKDDGGGGIGLRVEGGSEVMTFG